VSCHRPIEDCHVELISVTACFQVVVVVVLKIVRVGPKAGAHRRQKNAKICCHFVSFAFPRKSLEYFEVGKLEDCNFWIFFTAASSCLLAAAPPPLSSVLLQPGLL